MYESNGPDVKIRGNASHIAEKYLQLARDAQSSGDPISAENYYQHAEHYFRMIAAAQEQLRQSQPYYQQQQPQQAGDMRGNYSDDGYEDDENEQPAIGGEPFAPREAQPYYPREQQQQPQQYQHPQQQQPYQQPQNFQPRPQHVPQNAPATHNQDVDRLPSFITGGQQQPQQPQQTPQYSQSSNGPNGYDNQGGDRFPLHRRRRRHRGPRDHNMQGDFEGPPPSGQRPTDD